MIRRLLGVLQGDTPGPRERVSMRARQAAGALAGTLYELADQRTADAEHWRKAVRISAREANSAEVRERLRNRCRFEVANNAYARGMVDTLADDLIGPGPKLNFTPLTDAITREDAAVVELLWDAWCTEVDWWGKVRLLRTGRAIDGEAFAIVQTNERVNHSVKLDPILIEPERVSDPNADPVDRLNVDGVMLDEKGNATAYRVLREHPEGLGIAFSGDYDDYTAEFVVHYFRRDRAGQMRGVPDLAPAAALFAQVRRWTLATLAAAEAIANQALVIETQNPAEDQSEAATPGESFSLPSGQVTVLPDGYRLNQPKAEQPTAQFKEFKVELLKEAARCLGMPANIALADSADYNFASGRLDHAGYDRTMAVERAMLERVALNRVFRLWFEEASRLTGVLPQSVRSNPPGFRVSWTWPAREYGDPLKEAQAIRERLACGVSSLPIECARRGLDFEDVAAGQAEAVKLLESMGVAYTAPAAVPAGQGGPTDDDV